MFESTRRICETPPFVRIASAVAVTLGEPPPVIVIVGALVKFLPHVLTTILVTRSVAAATVGAALYPEPGIVTVTATILRSILLPWP